MNSQKLMIISILAALIIIGGAVAFVKFGNMGGNTTPPEQADRVVLDEIMSSCGPNDKCIIVDTQCSFCCGYVAINAKSELLFNDMFDKTCKHYKGSYCECHDLNRFPSCVNGRCQMVDWTEMQKNIAPGNARTIPARPAAQPSPAAVAPVQPQPMPVLEQPITQPVVQPQEIAPAPAPTPASAPIPTPAPAEALTVEPPPQEEPAPAITPAEEPASAPVYQPDSSEAFGEDAVPHDTPNEAAPLPDDDLNAPLPKTYTPPADPNSDGVHVIQP